MVKHFSVNWLAQSHHASTPDQDAVDNTPSQRPHVPCMVQPRPPTSYAKGCLLQAKRKPLKQCVVRTDSTEDSNQQESNFSASLRATDCSSPISEISGYSSGYESEAAASECLSVDEGQGGERDGERDGAQRRLRTKFSPEQIHKLERIFNKHKYLDAGERVKTAQKLNLSETQVRTWFQNRRMKLKREVQDLRAESYLAPAISPMMFQHMPPIQYHSFGGQRLQYAPPNQAFYPGVVPQFPLQQQLLPPQPAHLMMHSARFY